LVDSIEFFVKMTQNEVIRQFFITTTKPRNETSQDESTVTTSHEEDKDQLVPLDTAPKKTPHRPVSANSKH
jgi:hypothetical protein